MKQIPPRRLAFTCLYLTTPSLLILSLGFFEPPLFWWLAAALYLITALGLTAYFRWRPCGFPALWMGLAASPCLIFACETIQNSYFMKYLVTVLSAVYYALPFTLIAVVVFVASRASGKRA